MTEANPETTAEGLRDRLDAALHCGRNEVVDVAHAAVAEVERLETALAEARVGEAYNAETLAVVSRDYDAVVAECAVYRAALERIAYLDETEGAGDVGAAMSIARSALAAAKAPR